MSLPLFRSLRLTDRQDVHPNISCGLPSPGVSQSLGQRDAQDNPISLGRIFPRAIFSVIIIDGTHLHRLRVVRVTLPHVHTFTLLVLSFCFPNNSFFLPPCYLLKRFPHETKKKHELSVFIPSGSLKPLDWGWVGVRGGATVFNCQASILPNLVAKLYPVSKIHHNG